MSKEGKLREWGAGGVTAAGGGNDEVKIITLLGAG